MKKHERPETDSDNESILPPLEDKLLILLEPRNALMSRSFSHKNNFDYALILKP